jgi:hypothetical protein
MRFLLEGRRLGRDSLVIMLLSSSIGIAILPSVAAFSSSASGGSSGPSTLPSTTLVSAPPAGAKGPDDITMLATDGLGGGKALIWTAFQNGINPDGTPGTPGGPTMSTVAGYDPSTGALVRSISVTGKVDGLTADQDMGALIATVNEDLHSAFDVIYPAIGAVATYAYSPDPGAAGAGGTDSIAVIDGQIYVAHSNPNDLTQPTEYLVTLDSSSTTLTAKLTPVLYDNSMATNAVTGATVQLGLTDPDTNFLMPNESPRYAGDLATISQADGLIVFASHLNHSPKLTTLAMTDNMPNNVPPIDGLAVATSDHGTLYVVDAGAGTIKALDTTGWQAGTVFVGEPSDNGNPLVGVLNLSTGAITPLGNSFQSPKGLLFVPANGQDGGDGEHGDVTG